MKRPLSDLSPEQIKMAQAALQNAKDVVCECGASIFAQGVQLKRLSKIITGQPEDSFIPVPQFYCVKCMKPLSLEEPVNSIIS